MPRSRLFRKKWWMIWPLWAQVGECEVHRKRAAGAAPLLQSEKIELVGAAATLCFCSDDVAFRSALIAIALHENAIVTAGGDHFASQ